MASNPIAGWPMAPWLDWMSAGRGTRPPSDAPQRLDFVPFVNVTGKGQPELERQIVEDVATYGAQIGQISEIVLALAEGRDVSGLDALRKLRETTEAIERRKIEFGKTALERARKALSDLREHDRAGYDLLLATLDAQR